MTQTPTTAKDRRVSRRRSTAVLTALLAVVIIGGLGLIIAQRGNDTAGSGSSTHPDDVSVQIATGFIEAYRSFDGERAASYLAPDADLSAMEGGQEDWQAAIEWEKAQGFELILDSCVARATAPTGTTVRCPFDYHGIHSREFGLGPYQGSHFEIVVLDGEITRAVMLFEYRVNGFSNQVWEPFAHWVSENYPDDAAVMYTDASQEYENLTDDSIRLWALHAREYAGQVNQE